MNFETKYDYIVPIGSNCRIAIALRDEGIRTDALPFDWTLSTMKAVNHLFEDDFKDLTNKDVCVVKKFKFPSGKNFQYVLNTKYNLNITHEPNVNDLFVKKYDRRVKKLYDIIGNPENKVIFVRNNLDGKILDELHAHYISTEKDYNDFEVEHIEEFNSIIKGKFPELDFNILVINHTKPMDLSSDNIFNITSTQAQNHKLWDEVACKAVIKKFK